MPTLPALPALLAISSSDGDEQQLAAPRPHASTRWLPIVGIGCSAGGLHALETFFAELPAAPGAAFVVIQHLPPQSPSILATLLQRVSRLEVVEAEDGMVVERDRVYVIAGGTDMSLLHGSLHRLPQAPKRGVALPIDFFFRSMSQDQGDHSIGVILSGTGSDGTLGLRAIKEVAGSTFVQSPQGAEYDGMPRSAIESGAADVVAPVEELPARVLAYASLAPFASAAVDGDKAEVSGAIDRICMVLREQSGHDFTLYKRSTVYRRIERRMSLLQIRSYQEYTRLLRADARERELLFQELLIGVTSFFRDPAEWERLRQDVLRPLAIERAHGGVLRAWVAGCSTGEEAYSLAMVCKEAIEAARPSRPISVQVFATDIDARAIEVARGGFYPTNIVADVSPERLDRFFITDERGYRVNKEIRESVVFATHNVICDPPFTKVDVVCCRNLLIYLTGTVQKRLMPLFHYALNPGGVMFLGTAETIASFAHLFTPLDPRSRLFRRLEYANVTVPSDVPLSSYAVRSPVRERDDAGAGATRSAPPNVQTLVERVLVQRFAPLGVLCNAKGEVLYVSGRAGKYFEPAVGRADVSVFAMAREGLRYELTRSFAKALRQERPVTARGLRVGTNGGAQQVSLAVQQLTDPKPLAGAVLIVITDEATTTGKPPPATSARKASPRVAELEESLQRAAEETQTMREEMQTSQEELRSTNEELQSTNEELQSTNEELTTSKEEMQSLNEELQTVNQELRAKLDELSRSNSDMRNLLNSTDIATLFVDTELRVRRFTTATARIIKLIPADIGRSITDIASDLDYHGLVDDAREVLRTLVYTEKPATARDGRTFTVRVMPYRTVDNVIDGVVITFTDTTAMHTLERRAREQADELRQMTEALPVLVWAARPDGAFDYLGAQWRAYTGASENEHEHWGWLDAVHPDDRERVRESWRAAVRGGKPFDAVFRLRGHDDAYRSFKSRAAAVTGANGEVVRWYGASTDVDDLPRRKG